MEEEVATHSSILTLEISGTKEPGGLHSTESQTVGRDLVTKQQQQQPLHRRGRGLVCWIHQDGAPKQRSFPIKFRAFTKPDSHDVANTLHFCVFVYLGGSLLIKLVN